MSSLAGDLMVVARGRWKIVNLDDRGENQWSKRQTMVMNREQEIWGMALWVEKHHEANGHDFIAERIAALEPGGDDEGVRIWRQVATRYAQLRTGPIPIHGQPETQPN